MTATFSCPNCGRPGSLKKELPRGAKLRYPGCHASFSPGSDDSHTENEQGTCQDVYSFSNDSVSPPGSLDGTLDLGSQPSARSLQQNASSIVDEPPLKVVTSDAPAIPPLSVAASTSSVWISPASFLGGVR